MSRQNSHFVDDVTCSSQRPLPSLPGGTYPRSYKSYISQSDGGYHSGSSRHYDSVPYETRDDIQDGDLSDSFARNTLPMRGNWRFVYSMKSHWWDNIFCLSLKSKSMFSKMIQPINVHCDNYCNFYDMFYWYHLRKRNSVLPLSQRICYHHDNTQIY